jgi:flagellar biosynthetic protein FliR
LLVGLVLLMVVMGDLGQFLSRLLENTLQFMNYLITNMALP